MAGSEQAHDGRRDEALQTLQEARNKLRAAETLVQEAVALLEGAQPAVWRTLNDFETKLRRRMLVNAHRVWGLLHGGRQPPRREDILNARAAAPWVEQGMTRDEYRAEVKREELLHEQGRLGMPPWD